MCLLNIYVFHRGHLQRTYSADLKKNKNMQPANSKPCACMSEDGCALKRMKCCRYEKLWDLNVLNVCIITATHLETDKTNESSTGKFISRHFQCKHRLLVPACLPHYGLHGWCLSWQKGIPNAVETCLEITKLGIQDTLQGYLCLILKCMFFSTYQLKNHFCVSITCFIIMLHALWRYCVISRSHSPWFILYFAEFFHAGFQAR